ncbi:PadR family transcriptional regulator [Actinomycetospora cinnamomea]|uniref:DNA-binding PadR family transcriptional regulator n=1 Tax=Actinomycetospora cinnamomea TaxID=663609 RepID=A0A2U1FC69_9PSEU|nr:PadR family transcriptional regulator [Actinomycetospora cinnamomea]PVZ09570.1 DNA-binding PadR family transcriptional regulator [Actinomycetospora cinnamomea]
MTAEPQPPTAHDLSDAFGRPAAASLRGLLPPRRRRDEEDAAATRELEAGADGQAEAEVEVPAEEPGDVAADVPARREPRRRPAVPNRPATTGTGNRRWGPARLGSRDHVELLVLVALRHGPADGREIAERLQRDSDGGLTPPPTTIVRTVHHLARHGLVEHDSGSTRRRYRLTEPGRRAERARVREWRALRRAVDAVVRAVDEG